MSDLTVIVTKIMSGLFLGVATLIIMIAAVLGYAYSAKQAVSIPGIFNGWFSVENEMPALNFDPNGVGMVMFVIVIAMVYAAVSIKFSS